MILIAAGLCAWCFMIAGGHRAKHLNNSLNAGAIITALATLAILGAAQWENPTSDRSVYALQLERARVASTPWSGDAPKGDLLFNAFLWLVGHLSTVGQAGLFASAATVFIAGHVMGLRLILAPGGVLLAFLTLLASGLFLAYTGVAVRQGLAGAVLMVAVGLVASGRGNWKSLLPLLLAASLFHWSAVPLAAGLFVLSIRMPSVRAAIIVWCLLAAAFVAGLNSSLLGGVPVTGLEMYTSPDAFDNYGNAGLRLDFLAVSAVCLAVGLWGVWWSEGDVVQRRLVVIFVLFNSLFLLMGFIAFSDRLASYSWFLFPSLLWRPMMSREGESYSIGPMVAVALIVTVGFSFGDLAEISRAIP